jgi:hypothetical protein
MVRLPDLNAGLARSLAQVGSQDGIGVELVELFQVALRMAR